MRHEYDVVVVGAGPAGGAMASACAKAGKKVALIESQGFGGTCPLRGCNPKKVLLAGAEAVSMAAHLRGRGLTGPPTVDWPALMAFKDSFVEPVPDRAEKAYQKLGVDTFHGLARFIGPDTLETDADQFRAGFVALCPGMRPADLAMPGADLCVDSTAFLSLPGLPKRMAFIGGGFVAMELACIAARCGSEVTVLVRSRPLKEFDPDLVDQLVTACRESGMDLRLAAPTTAVERAVERKGDGYVVHLGDGETLEADLVVNAAGRVPDLEPLGLDKAGVEYGPRGIAVNEFMQSVSNPRVYAAGDAADTPLPLTPTAVIQARAAAANMVAGTNRDTADHFGVPYVCFTIPPIASVGLSEEEARERVPDLEVRTGSLADNFPWKRLGETHGAYKLLKDKEQGLLVGAHVMGHMADEMINTLGLIVRGRIPLDTVKNQVWAYPTCTYYLQYMLG